MLPLFKSFHPRYLARQIGRGLHHQTKVFYVHNEYFDGELDVTTVLDLFQAEWKKKKRPETLEVACEERLRFSPLRNSDLILAHHPILNCPNRLVDRRCFGMQSWNRAERMEYLEKMGFPVSPWASCASESDVKRLFHKWGDEILFKRDLTCRSEGVHVIREKDVGYLNFTSADVFSPIFEEDPSVYKVHFWGPTVIGSYALNALPIKKKTPTHSASISEFTPPPALIEQIGKIGEQILKSGGFYQGLDLMKSGGEFVAIELNTNNVGTKALWTRQPDQVTQQLCAQLETFLDSPFPFRLGKQQLDATVAYFQTPIRSRRV